MPTPQLSFTKVVFPPTRTIAVHTYTAGSFFSVTALTTPEGETHDVHSIGKELFSNLEAEFFSLEEKTLISIKKVIEAALENIPETIHISFTAAYIKDGAAYLFIAGDGNILLKRADKLAEILHAVDVDTRELKSASGYVQPNDVLFLETADFARHISTSTLQSVSDRLPNEIADMATSRLQTVENSGAASIILRIEGFLNATPYVAPIETEGVADMPENAARSIPPQSMINQPYDTHSEGTDEMDEKETPSRAFPNIFKRVSLSHFPFLHKLNLSLKTKIGIIVAIIIVIILAISINGIKIQRQNAQNQTIFHKYYDEAQRDYESGNGIAVVNPLSPNAKDEWQKADSLLKTAQQQLSPTSPEAKQVNDLLAQVDTKLSQVNNIQTVQVSDATASDSPLLAAEQKQNVSYVSADDSTIYYINNTGIYKSDASTPVIKNSSDWSNLGGLSAYDGNLYVLDKQKNILKYTSGSGGYGKSNYLKSDVSPNFSKAVSMAIDSSVYVLSSDGSIVKYTKGEPDTFTVQGIDKPLSSPTRIFTNADTESVYVLDNGNSRIVKFGKDGTYQGQYAADVLAKAKDIDVHESDKKIFILTTGGIKSISM